MPVDKNDSWWQRHKRVIWLSIILSCIFLILGIGILGYIFQLPWVGFNAYQDPKHPIKTLWDWIQILALPGLATIIATWLTVANHEREQRMAAQRAETERTIALENRQASLLREYVDRISNLLLEHKLRDPESDVEARNIARAHTLIVLPHLNEERKGRLLQFLYESQLIIAYRKDCISLKNADLRKANLRDFDLSGADLSGANLIKAELSGAFLSEAQLQDTVLDDADLSGATLRRANLCEAKLRGATLNGALLQDADLSYAKLLGASLARTNLIGANLSDAITTGARLDQTIYNERTFSKEQLSKMRKL